MTIIKILREAYDKCENGLEKYIYYINRDFENGKIKSSRYYHNEINIRELFHENNSIYCIEA